MGWNHQKEAGIRVGLCLQGSTAAAGEATGGEVRWGEVLWLLPSPHSSPMQHLQLAEPKEVGSIVVSIAAFIYTKTKENERQFFFCF